MSDLAKILFFLGDIAFLCGPAIALVLAMDARKGRRFPVARRCAAVALYGAALGFPGAVLCIWLGNDPGGEYGWLGLVFGIPFVGVVQGVVSLLAWLFLRREDRRMKEEAGGPDGEAGA